MINQNALVKEKLDYLPSEAIEAIKILDELEKFTIGLRDNLLLELNSKEADPIKLKLDKIA